MKSQIEKSKREKNNDMAQFVALLSADSCWSFKIKIKNNIPIEGGEGSLLAVNSDE